MEQIKETPPLNVVAANLLEAMGKTAQASQDRALGRMGAQTAPQQPPKRAKAKAKLLGVVVKKTGQTIYGEADAWPTPGH